MNVSVVIPCYNSSRSLPELIERIDQSMKSNNFKYEVVCVNDCSKDNTMEVLRLLSSQYQNLRVIDLVFNVGQFKTLLCAMEHCRGDYVVTMDDDLQHKPEDIPLLVNALEENPTLDVVIASYKSKKHKIYRNAGTLLIRWVDKRIFNKPDHLKTSSFRAMRKVFVDSLVAHKTQFPVIGPLILSLTRQIQNVEVEHQPRKYGKSNYKLSKLISTTFDNVLNFSSLPLKSLGIIGVFSATLSVFIALFFFIKYLVVGTSVQGWTSLIILLNFYSGLILLSIGIIGEYLIRILKESNNSPRYCIREKLNF